MRQVAQIIEQACDSDVTVLNRNLEEMMQRGEFREDLYYRLKVIETTVPPLRERRDEILPLTDFFIAKYSGRYSRPARLLSPAVRRLFQAYDWPGNIRQLENMIKRFVILQDEQLVARELSRSGLAGPRPRATMSPDEDGAVAPPMEAPSSSPTGWQDGRTLPDIARDASRVAERVAILDTLRQVRWNRRQAAQMLGVCYKTLLNKIKEAGIEPPE
jgi:two-component system response regulator AtoC